MDFICKTSYMGIVLLIALGGCGGGEVRAPPNVAAAFSGIEPGMTSHDVVALLGPPTERAEFKVFARDSSLWSISNSDPEPVRIGLNRDTIGTYAPGDTTHSRTDTWEIWDGRPPNPHMQTWEVFYGKESGEWRVTSAEDRSTGIVFS